MSTYFSVFDCLDCHHRVTGGFVGELNGNRIFCRSCHAAFFLSPPEGETYLQSSGPHRLMSYGKAERPASSKKGRVKKILKVAAWVSTGERVPVSEELRQIGEKLFLTYRPQWEQVTCPACRQSGSLCEYQDYVESCPHCGGSRMRESSL